MNYETVTNCGCVGFLVLAAAIVVGISNMYNRPPKRGMTRRPPEDHCERCGYDIRASPDRCPECGAYVRRFS